MSCTTLDWELFTLRPANSPPATQSSFVPFCFDLANASSIAGPSASFRSSTTLRATRWLWMMSICVCMKPMRSRAEGTVPDSDCSSRLSSRIDAVAS